MVDTEQIQEQVRVLLEEWGYTVEPIPVAPNTRRADYLATLDDERIAVEVTSKSDDGRYDRDLRSSGEAFHEGRIQRTGAVDRALHGKNDQLRSTPQASDASRILWIEAVGPFQKTIAEQIEATFYGRISVPVPEGNHASERYCYFFDHASCHSLRWVDAVMVSLGDSGRLLVNPESDGDLSKLRSTRLASLLESAGALVLPHDEEESGRAFSAHDFPGDRRDEQAKRLFMEDKYGVRPFIPLRWKVTTAGKQVESRE